MNDEVKEYGYYQYKGKLYQIVETNGLKLKTESGAWKDAVSYSPVYAWTCEEIDKVEHNTYWSTTYLRTVDDFLSKFTKLTKEELKEKFNLTEY